MLRLSNAWPIAKPTIFQNSTDLPSIPNSLISFWIHYQSPFGYQMYNQMHDWTQLFIFTAPDFSCIILARRHALCFSPSRRSSVAKHMTEGLLLPNAWAKVSRSSYHPSSFVAPHDLVSELLTKYLTERWLKSKWSVLHYNTSTNSSIINSLFGCLGFFFTWNLHKLDSFEDE